MIAPNRADEQAAAVLDRLETTLKGVQSSLDRLVKVDVYLARPDAVAIFQKAFARRMAGRRGRRSATSSGPCPGPRPSWRSTRSP